MVFSAFLEAFLAFFMCFFSAFVSGAGFAVVVVLGAACVVGAFATGAVASAAIAGAAMSPSRLRPQRMFLIDFTFNPPVYSLGLPNRGS